VIVGNGAGGAISTGSGENVVLGNSAGAAMTTGQQNVLIGDNAAAGAALTGSLNIIIGDNAAYNVTGACTNNTVVGAGAASGLTTGDNNLILGNDAGITGSPGGNITTANHTISLGDENIGTCNIQTDWTVASDARDKTDIEPVKMGLDFVNKLEPVTYRWDKRSKYVDRTDPDIDLNKVVHDGTHKEDWSDIGFLAQDVEVLEEKYGHKIGDKTNLTTNLSEDGKQYGLTYSKFVPILVKAIQELSDKNKVLEEQVKTLIEGT